jgi:hypothetical protein
MGGCPITRSRSITWLIGCDKRQSWTNVTHKRWYPFWWQHVHELWLVWGTWATSDSNVRLRDYAFQRCAGFSYHKWHILILCNNSDDDLLLRFIVLLYQSWISQVRSPPMCLLVSAAASLPWTHTLTTGRSSVVNGRWNVIESRRYCCKTSVIALYGK